MRSRASVRMWCRGGVGALKRFQRLPRGASHDEPAMEARLSKLIPSHGIVGVKADRLFQDGERSSGLRPVRVIEGVPGSGAKGVRCDQQAVPWGETVIMTSSLEPQRPRVF